MRESDLPTVEIVRDDRGWYWRPEGDEKRRSEYFATRDEARRAANRWRIGQRSRSREG